MGLILLVGRLPASSKAARDKLIAGLGKIADYAKNNDPETTKHATHVLQDESDETTVWAIEEYTSQEACDAHMKWPPVLDFLQMCTDQPDLLAGAPEIWHSEQKNSFTRPELLKKENPFVLLAKLSYHPDRFAEGLEGWKPVVAHGEKNEPGVLAYSVGKDVEHENRLTLVEAYESEKYLKNVHFKSKPVQKKLHEEDELRSTEPEVVCLRQVAGYWYK
ncbi:hypothetical protein EJ08DRAFT_696657 [Tothia fuscella]|uniref:ABM domain-containing protein n=1 Tax=Tothia fuscella TaxID=1048955 RepID=A0A9P4TZD0_9PEZI|nr:hypothetical protein EJ08DRAFT_696657 [Tothia fuscella]